MTKKHYLAPKAEVLLLIPNESVMSDWHWGVYESDAVKASVTNTIWNPWDYTAEDESYKINE